ncbi:hypothetical protein BC936DRAFT_148666 [Jimgerdemannia flammicorona]|uniref:Rho GTPase activation protein n=1 Tax=Jimgerdemannia flammicorona TaxID=994334 RepID=A0A433D2I0_9FUNG|nr:hypothetical protein BC936DRAFT_148666 [Jimgerdemannia flammicorona]
MLSDRHKDTLPHRRLIRRLLQQTPKSPFSISGPIPIAPSATTTKSLFQLTSQSPPQLPAADSFRLPPLDLSFSTSTYSKYSKTSTVAAADRNSSVPRRRVSIGATFKSSNRIYCPPPLVPVAEVTYNYSLGGVAMSPSRDHGDMNGHGHGHDSDRVGDRYSESTDDRTMFEERGSTEGAGEMDTETRELVMYLTDLDCGLQCLLDKVKQDMHQVKDAVLFLKKRAAIEEEYARAMIKLSQMTAETFDKTHPKSGTYGDAWTSMLKVHETVGEQRLKFAADILEVSDDMNLLFKDTERSRKQMKETGMKHEKNLQDAEIALDKAKSKYEMHSEEWERSILQKNNDPLHRPKKGLFNQAKTPQQLERQEEDARMKAAISNENYKSQLAATNQARHDYFHSHLPKILSILKETGDECAVALRYHLSRYAYVFEQAVVADGYALDNDDGGGLRSLAERINKDVDLKDFVKSYGGRVGRVQGGEIPYREYNMSSTAQTVINARPLFGIDLGHQMERDNEEIPTILIKCAQAVEQYGMTTQGIYRISGTNTQIQKLRGLIDRGIEQVDLNTDEYISDINNVTSILKLWFRELPDPLFPKATYNEFIRAAKIEDEARRVNELHAAVNRLPDPNYATLKFLMCHLDRVQAGQRHNKMGVPNLAIVFGPTLMGGDQGASSGVPADASKLADMHWQVKVVETILENYRLIFEPDDE